MKRWKIGISVLFIVAMVATLVLIGGCDKTSPQQELTVGYFAKAIGHAPYYVAKHHGWFEESPDLAKWTIKHVEYGDRPTISQAFDKGELQFLLAADIPTIMCRAQGNDIRIVALSGLITLQWLVRSELLAESPAELKGKKIAFLPGTSSHYGFLTTLISLGLSEEDLVVSHMTPPEARSAFEGGQIDSWIVWSPFFDQQLVNGKGRRLAGTDYRYTVTASVTASFLEDHPKQVDALIGVLQRAKDWIAQNPHDTYAIVAEATGHDAKVVEMALKSIDYSATITEEMVIMFQSMADFIAKQGKTRLDRVVDIQKELVASRYYKPE